MPQRRRRDAVTGLLLFTGACLLVPGLLLPAILVERFWVFETEKSIAGVAVSLFTGGDIPLAAVIVVFSVVLPAAKLAVALAAWFADGRAAGRLIAWSARLGRWSMLDVFLVALVIAVLSLDAVASITAGPGAYLFCAAVLATMAGTHRLERRGRS